jgi:CheY-like chemotaxis protein/glycine cleavage system H lipoate-binding protein
MKVDADILVIDDEQVILDAVKKICSSEGYRVVTAPDAAEAVDLLEKQSFGIILCDIMMPRMDGFAFLKYAVQHIPETPVIMATGFSTVENAVQSLTVGAVDYIPKPFTFDELTSAIQRGLKMRKIREEVAASVSGTTADGTLVVPCPPKFRRLGHTSWVFLENDGTATVGVTHLLVRTIDQVIGVETVPVDGEITQGTACGRIQTLDGHLHPILSPVSGRVVEVNNELKTFPAIIEKDPYFTGWLYHAIPTDVEYEIARLQPCGSDPLT